MEASKTPLPLAKKMSYLYAVVESSPSQGDIDEMAIYNSISPLLWESCPDKSVSGVNFSIDVFRTPLTTDAMRIADQSSIENPCTGDDDAEVTMFRSVL